MDYSIRLRHLAVLFFLSFVSTQSPAAFAPAKRPYDALNYRIQIEIDPSTDPREFIAEAEVKVRASETLQSISLDTQDLKIESVRVIAPYSRVVSYEMKESGELISTLPKKLAKGTILTLAIRYQGKIGTGHKGFFRVTDPDEPDRGPLLFTHFEPTGARSFFPCNDEPYDKATTEIVAKVPARYEALSNGKRFNDKKFKKGWHEIQWRQEKPHSTYLVSLAVAPFARLGDLKASPEITLWVGAARKERAEFALQSTIKSMEFFEKYLEVPYPWAKYATVGLPTFLWGGMENTSSTHMNQERTLLNDPNSAFEKKRIVGLAAHELAHQWFGDYVTMAWWDDLWLNEAFASHMGQLATRDQFKNDEAEIETVLYTWDGYFRQEDGPRSHPIVDKAMTSADDAFDTVNYTKGENVLRMLSFLVGEANFRAGLTAYLKTHALGNATGEEFFAVMEKTTNRDLKVFRDGWLRQRGYPIVTYAGRWQAADNQYALTLTQKSNHAGDSAVFPFAMPVVFHRKSAPAFEEKVTIDVGGAKTEHLQKLPAEPEWVTINAGGIVLAKVEPADLDESKLVLQAASDPDTIGRIWALYTLGAPLREGKEPTAAAQSALVKAMREDRSPYVRGAVLALFGKMKLRWLPDRLSETVFELARTAAERGGMEKTPLYHSDPHGWSQWRSDLLGALGKVNRKETLPLLAKTLARTDLPLDDLGEAASAVAALGSDQSAAVLKETARIQGPRGYRYRYVVNFAFGAYESPKAAAEIRELSKTAGADLMGRIGGAVKDNQTLKTSSEWATFLTDFVLAEGRFDDEVKARLLQTIEEVKTSSAESTLKAIVEKSPSVRLKEAAKKVLEKNFARLS